MYVADVALLTWTRFLGSYVPTFSVAKWKQKPNEASSRLEKNNQKSPESIMGVLKHARFHGWHIIYTKKITRTDCHIVYKTTHFDQFKVDVNFNLKLHRNTPFCLGVVVIILKRVSVLACGFRIQHQWLKLGLTVILPSL